LDTREIRYALDSLDGDVKFDAVILDACYGATLDMALIVSDRARFMVASVDTLPGSGLDYSLIDFDADGLRFAMSVADSLTSYTGDMTPAMSVIQLDQVPPLVDFLDELGPDATLGLERLAIYVSNSYFLVELGDVLGALPDDKRETLQDLLSNSVLHRSNPGSTTSGLSLVVAGMN
jgi:hypothetical protein